MKFGLCLLAGCAFALGFARGAYAEERPHVLFVAIDDLNDWVGCLNGHPQARTPNIDSLAARGVLFNNAHCAATACNPSRAAIFSGRLPPVTKVWSNSSGAIQRLYPAGIRIPVAFSRSGYQTLGTGKLLHSKVSADFDEYYSVEQRWSPFKKKEVQYSETELPTKGTAEPRHRLKDSRGRDVTLPLNGMPSDRNPTKRDGESFDWGPFDVPDSDFGDTQITDWAIGQLESYDEEKPLFMGVGYYRPHIPLWAPQRFFDRFRRSPALLPEVAADDLLDLSSVGKRWAIEPVTAGSHDTVLKYKQWQAAVEAYLACVTYVDHEVGRLIDALDRSGLADNTVIVLWSDHGWHLGEKQHWGKWTGWERSTRVPLIVVPPKRTASDFAAGGSVCEQPVGLIDLYPTLAEWCDVEAPDPLDGVSLLPQLRRPGQKTERVIVTYFDEGNVSLRSERWRYLRYADGSEELYDMINDPREWKNLGASDSHRSERERFRSMANRVSLAPAARGR